MNRHGAYNFLMIVIGVALCGLASAGDLGDVAPPLKVDQWVKGRPVDLKDKGTNIYAIIFWETECGACREIIPYLTQLQNKFKDDGVVMIAVSPEPVDRVRTLVGQMGETLGFVVATDNRNETYDAYMKAYGEAVIPHAFLLDKQGKIAWHGHPLAGLEKAVEEMASGKFDLEAAKRVANANQLRRRYFAAVQAEKKGPEIEELGNRVLTDGAANPWLLNHFAWQILTAQGLKTRDLELALRAAKAANDGVGGTNSAFSDTYARALYDNGKVPEAIEMQKHAIACCKEERERTYLEQTLKRYESKQ